MKLLYNGWVLGSHGKIFVWTDKIREVSYHGFICTIFLQLTLAPNHGRKRKEAKDERGNL